MVGDVRLAGDAMTDKRAIIDIGSNTIRLVVYNGPPRAPIVLLNEKVTPRLGRDVEKTGALAEDSMEMALDALARYAALLEMLEVSNVQAVATAAVRDAENGLAFLNKVRSFGLKPKLISGEEEARISALGVVSAFPGATGVCGDLGGGSLELTRVENGEPQRSITMPLGTLRLPPLRTEGEEAFAKTIRKRLKSNDWKEGKGEPFYIAGGSWRALAIYAMSKLDWPLDDPHDFELSAKNARALCDELLADGPKADTSRISSSRLETMPDAAALLRELIDRTKPSRIVFSSWGLREGLLYDDLPDDIRAEDPMLAGVTEFATGYAVSPDQARQVDTWIATALPCNKGDERLRLAATMLSLATMRGEPNMRAEQAMNWALRKRWIGLDARGRAMIAMAVLANSNNLGTHPELERLASKADLAIGATWGLGVRLCRKLTWCAEQALQGTELRREKKRLVLAFADEASDLCSPSVIKNLKRLADWMELDWALENCACEVAD